MRLQSIHLELPRRIAGYFLLCGAAALAWFGGSAIVLWQKAIDAHLEQSCLSQIDRAASQVKLSMTQPGPVDLQPMVERLRAEGSLAYCAVVSSDGRIVAHSSRDLNGRVFQEPLAPHGQQGKAVSVRFRDADRREIMEYRVPLRRGEEDLGALHLAVVRPDVLEAFRSSVPHLSMMLAGPVIFMLAGVLLTWRALRPVATIETQLARIAAVPSLADLVLPELPGHGPASFGWNRLADHVNRAGQQSPLGQRLSEAVEALHAQRSDEILNSIPDGIAVTDPKGNVTFANRALCAVLGAEGEEGPVGRPLDAWLGLDGGDESQRSLLDPRLAERAAVAELERPHEGAKRVLRVGRYPLQPAGRQAAAGCVWSVRDISQQKLAEQMRDQFLDTASHELRTPLATIRAYAETLSLSEEMELERQKEFCNTINAEASRLARLIDDLLDISSMEVGSLSLVRQETDVERLVREVVGKVRPQMDQKGMTLQTSFPEKWPKLRLDKDKIATALVNLLGNAAKYTPEGGRVTLRVAAAQGHLAISVEDTGVGISEADLAKIFDKFFRSADPRVQNQIGSGLGLSLTREIAEMHGGALSVTSELNVGSKFTMTLPLA